MGISLLVWELLGSEEGMCVFEFVVWTSPSRFLNKISRVRQCINALNVADVLLSVSCGGALSSLEPLG
jgi:hypothetical protein